MVLLTSVALLAGGGAAGYAAKSRVDVAADPADGREAGCAGDDGTKWLSPGARAADEPAVPESLEEMTELYVRLTDTEAALAAARRRESEKGLLLTEATRRAERAEADLQTERRLLADGSAREHGLQEQLAALQEGLRLERQRADAESEAMQAERAELRDALAAAQAALSTERQLSRRANDRADEQESRARALETERDLLDARYAAAAEELQGLLRRAEVAPPAEPPVQPSPRGARSAAPLPPGEAALQRRLQRASRPVVAATPPCPPPPVAAGLQGASPARGRTAAGGSSEEGTSASPTALHARGAPWEQESSALAATPSTSASSASNYAASEAADVGEAAPVRWVARSPATPCSPAGGPSGPRTTQLMVERLRLGHLSPRPSS